VPSDVPLAWKFCYKHHSHMDAPQYVHIHVPSAYFCFWMFYYTLHNDTYVPQYVSPVAVS
jgi:hypothetical protein